MIITKDYLTGVFDTLYNMGKLSRSASGQYITKFSRINLEDDGICITNLDENDIFVRADYGCIDSFTINSKEKILIKYKKFFVLNLCPV